MQRGKFFDCAARGSLRGPGRAQAALGGWGSQEERSTPSEVSHGKRQCKRDHPKEVVRVTMEGNAVLLAEDDEMSRSATCQFLRRFGYKVGEATDGPSALREASMGHYDLVILGPWPSGPRRRRRLGATAPKRRHAGHRPYRARSEEGERVQGPRPRSRRLRRQAVLVHELEARIRAVLRRGQVTPTYRARGGRATCRRPHAAPCRARRGAARSDSEGVRSSGVPRSSPDQVYSREELLEHVWGSTQDWQDPATVTEHVRRLRLKLETDPASPRWLQTVRGVGYRLSHDDGAGMLHNRTSRARPRNPSRSTTRSEARSHAEVAGPRADFG